MQPAPIVTSTHPIVYQHGTTVIHPPPPLKVSVKETRAMGIMQVVIGALSIVLGIPAVAVLQYYAAYVAYPIWSGVWIVVGGSLGIASASNAQNSCLNGTHMAFNIVSCCISFVDFIVYAVAVAFYRGGNLSRYRCTGYGYNLKCGYVEEQNWRTGVAIYSILLIAMIAEFIIALTASIYCCKAGCNCCNAPQPGVIVQQPYVQPVVSQVSYVQTSAVPPMSTMGHANVAASGVYPMSYPSIIAPGYTQASATAPHTASSDQPHYTPLSGHTQNPADTRVAYSGQGAVNAKENEASYEVPYGPPPAYS